jgi:hypothetical protein
MNTKRLLLVATLISGLVLPCVTWGQATTIPQGNPGKGGVGNAGSPQTQVLKNVPWATPNESTVHPAIPAPGDGLSDEEREVQNGLLNSRQGSPNGDIKAAPSPPAEPTVPAEGPNTPGANAAFLGQSEPGTLRPSDMGLAVNQSFVVQLVNANIAVYNKSGTLQTGFPKTLNAFLGLPSTANTFDPRALYDWVSNRFIVVIDEGVFKDSPNGTGFLHLAVSQTSDPRGAWNLYTIQSIFAGTNQCPDFPTLGQDRAGIYIGMNLFTCDSKGLHNFINAHVFLIPKSIVYPGQSLAFWEQFGFFVNVNGSGVNVDTLQPANIVNLGDIPRAEFVMNSLNINFSGGQCTNGCKELDIWAISNPFGFLSNGPSPVFSLVRLSTAHSYFKSRGAHQPGANFTIATGDPRISGGVVYHAGSLFLSNTTGCIPQCNPPGVVEATTVIWYEIAALTLDDNGDGHCTGGFLNRCPQIKNAAIRQEDCFFCGGFGGDNSGSAYYGTLQPDADNNVTMVYNFSNSQFNPGTAYTSRRVTQLQNTMHDIGSFLVVNNTFYNQTRWGDYTATALDLSHRRLAQMWFSGMFVQSNGNWGTGIGANRFGSVDVP